MYIRVRRMVQSSRDTDRRTPGQSSRCALRYKPSRVFRVFIMRHIFCANGAYDLVWGGVEAVGGGAEERGGAALAGTDSTSGHAHE